MMPFPVWRRRHFWQLLYKVWIDHTCEMWADSNPNVNILIETFKNCHQAVNSKTVEPHFADARKVGGCNDRLMYSSTHRNRKNTEATNALGGRKRLQLHDYGIGVAVGRKGGN